MDEHPRPAEPVVPWSPGSQPSAPPPPRRRRLFVPTVVALVALGVAGTGIGYAVGRSGVGSVPSSTLGNGPTSSRTFGHGYGQGYGYGQGDGQGQQAPQVAPQQSSTDSTSTASGAQLTGLVRIVTTMRYDGAKAAGTGMVLTADGDVVTNHHVVAGATSISATVMSTGRSYAATVVGTDIGADVAVLKLSGASALATVTTDTATVSPGAKVTAVGDGDGTVDHLSAATGTVLATGQAITTQSDGTSFGESLSGLIEISSDVVGGYSGGPTYDAQGAVIAMTTAASSGTNDAVGYAIPVSTVLTVAHALEDGTRGASYTYGTPAFLGVGLGDGGTTVQAAYAGTPAARAGIGAGDTITAVGSVSTQTATQLRAAIGAHRPGDRVRLTWRDASGARHTAAVTLSNGPVQ